MDTNKVSVKQSYDLIRGQMNSKLSDNLQEILENQDQFLAKEVIGYKNLQQLSFIKTCEVVNSSLNKYLSQKQSKPGDKSTIKAMSSVIAEMGGSLFQNFRIYRDMLYTKQNRESRLLACFKGQLAKAVANRDRETAYI